MRDKIEIILNIVILTLILFLITLQIIAKIDIMMMSILVFLLILNITSLVIRIRSIKKDKAKNRIYKI